MAKKRRKKSGSTTASTGTKTRRRRTSSTGSRKGIMGIPQSGGTMLQKLARAGLLTLAAIAGGAAGAGAGKPSGVLGLGTIAASTMFLPLKWQPYAAVAGAAMIVTPTRALPGTQPAAVNGIAGIEGFAEDATNRVKGYLADVADKTYVGDKIKPALGLGNAPVNYVAPGKLNLEEWERGLRSMYNLPKPRTSPATDDMLAGTQNSNLLAGLGMLAKENALV